MTRREKVFRVTAMTVLSCLALTIGCTNAAAQRTMNKQNMASLCCYTPITGAKDFGAELCWGRYLIQSYWKIEADAGLFSRTLDTNDIMTSCSITFGGTYMHRLVCNRSRSMSLYSGGGAFIGYEFYDPMKKLPNYIDTSLPNGMFLYGIQAGLEGEFFICRKLALVAYIKVPVNFSSPVSKVSVKTGGGLRINL